MCLSEYRKAESVESVKAEANVSLNLFQSGVNEAVLLKECVGLPFLFPVLLFLSILKREVLNKLASPSGAYYRSSVSIFQPNLYVSI